MKNIFVQLYSVFERRKPLLFILFTGLLLIMALLASKLNLNSDVNAMMPQGKQKDKFSVLTKNPVLDRLIVSVSSNQSTEPEQLIQSAETLVSLLQKNDHTHLIDSVELKPDEDAFIQLLETIPDNLPFLLEEKDYTYLDQLQQPAFLDSVFKRQYHLLSTPGSVAFTPLLQKDLTGISFQIIRKLREMQLDDHLSLYDGYLISKDQKYLNFFIHTSYPASDTKHNEGLNDLIQTSVQELKQTPAESNTIVHAFGAQLVAAGNAAQMRNDTWLTLSITLSLLLLLFISFFRNLLAPLHILIPVCFGALFGMSMMYVLYGEVSMIALGASSVILGIAVNYSLHFLSHYRHCRNRKETIAELSAPMTIGSFTTISAFLGLSFMHTPVLQQLGVFTAFNLIGSSLCTLIFLPHFVGSRENHAHKKNWIDRLAGFRPEKRKGILILILIITAVLSLYIDRVRFDEDMLKMNYMRADLKEAQQLIQQQNSESLNSMFCVSEGPTLNAALYKSRTSAEQLEQLKKEQLIRRYSSPSRFIPDSVSAKTKLAYWNRYWTLHDKDAFISQCRFAAERNGFSTQALDGLEHILSKSYLEPDPNLITGFKKLFTALWTEDKDGVKIIQWIRCNQENRNLLIERMKHTESSYLIDRQMLTSAWVDVIRKDFYNILFLTSFIVFFTILLSYGRIEIAIISFLPMVITWFCILGLMGILHIEFNIINVIISTLIFGLGDDYSIFITDGLLEKYRYGTSRIQSVKTSVYLSAITTILGLGILIFAKHPALKSIALVSVIGILCILFISQTLQPFLFSIFIQNRSDRKQYPFTFWSLLKSVFAFTYYLVGCILVTLVGFILTRCIPFARYRMKYIYHVIICKMMWSLLYIMASVKKKIENRHYSDFNTPAVLIANHSSFLDLLRIISLHPKILLLTNRWVWRSPVFGALVRMADYYPVEEGAEFSVDKLKEWTDRGYSIAVFPEGTRSYTDEIKRFHKGAFYIAEKLQLDIQPILFQGIGHSMRKGDFLLKDTEINISFLPRIKPNDTTFGTGYSERARRIGKYFREEHKKYSLEKETPAYYRTQLIHSFIYKGPVLEWYCRIKTRIEKNYERIESLIGKEDHILDIGCGYGFLDFILHWTGPERTIRAIDYDEEKIAMAQHIALRNETLQFESTDLLHFTTQQSFDTIVMLDVLHYLDPSQQDQVLQKIISLLKPGGQLLLRDGFSDLGRKLKGTRLSEFFSVQVFRFNKSHQTLHYPTMEKISDWATKNNLQINIIEEPVYTANVLLRIKKIKA